MYKITIEPNQLSKEEIELLKKAQIEVIVKKLPKKGSCRRKQLKEYTLEIKSYCQTCGSTFNTYFKMEKSGKRGLKGNRFFFPLVPDKREERLVTTCNKCKGFLKDLSKEELINKYLKERS